MTFENFSYLYGGIESIATILALLVGAFWAIRLYLRQRENVPWIEFTADIAIIGKHGNDWIVELVALLENKGKVQHRLFGPHFALDALNQGDPLIVNTQQFNGQTQFPHSVLKGTFLPQSSAYFFVEPGVRAKYSYVTHVPANTRFLIMHTWFKYPDGRHGHSAECTVEVK